MESELVSYDSYCCDMPMEVLSEILLHLPVKSLIRFTCVCKSWLQLIREPQFSVKHYLLRTSKQSQLMNNVDYFVDYFGNNGRGCESITSEQPLRCCICSLTENKTFRIAKKIEFGHGLEVSVSNFCHGILCVLVRASTRDAKFLLCNLAIREVVPIRAIIKTEIYGGPVFGLGFDPTSNDYKILAINPPEIRGQWVVDVYSVRSGSWHNVQAITPLEKFSTLDRAPALNNNGRILNWLGYCRGNVKKRLLSFDMTDEAFKETSLPECVCLYSNWREHHLLSCSHFQAVICCFSRPYFDLIGNELFNTIDIWVLNGNGGDNMCWSKHVSLRFPNSEMAVWPMNIWMNDKEVFVYVEKRKEGVIGVFHYDLDTQVLKRTGRSGTLSNPDVYAESIVSIKGFMSSSTTCNGVNTNDGNNASQQHKDNNESIYFIREVGRRNDVRWSYNFKLGSR